MEPQRRHPDREDAHERVVSVPVPRHFRADPSTPERAHYRAGPEGLTLVARDADLAELDPPSRR